MRRLAAAARGGPSHLLRPGAAQLSTSAPASSSLWRQALAAAAAALGGAPAASSSGAAAAVPPAAAAAPVSQPEAERSLSNKRAAQQQAQAPPAAGKQQHQKQEQLHAWRRGAEGGSARRQHKGAPPAAAGQLGLGDWSRRNNRRARRQEKQWAPEVYAAAAGQQPAAATATGNEAGRDERRRGRGHKKGGRSDGTGAHPSSSKAVAAVEPVSEGEVIEDAEAEAAAVGTAVAACPLPPARILQDDAHPIRETDISRAAWMVMSRLRAAGHEVYVVGGTVRDLLLGGTPKDFDILTSAEPHQIKRLFSRCMIVGRAFPVCQVFTEGTMIEVSSFSTQADTRLIPLDASVHMIGRQKGKDAKWSREGATWADARATNAARRDFTVNGLLYEPFSRLLFDSVGGLDDCQARRLRTICPPAQSFATDPARILRGVRLAARANLELDPATAQAMEENAAAIGQLAQGRLQMELTSLLGYGASERSLLLMWRLGLLDMLLPQHALYLRRHKVPRAPRSRSRSRRPELLFALAAELDKHVHPQRPVDPCVWVALLAAPLIVERISERWRQAFRDKACATDGLQQAAEEDTAAAAGASAGLRDEQESRMGEGMSSSLAGQEGSASDGDSSSGGNDSGRSSGAARKHGSDGESGPLAEGQQLPPWPVSKEEAWRREFVDPYQQIVWEVLDSMLLPLDSDTMQQLGRQAKKHAQQLQQIVGGKRRRRAAAATDSAGPERPLLPSVLTRTALERAASLLHMEAELRGRPELQALLERSGWPGKVAPAFRHSGDGGGGTSSGAMLLEAGAAEQREPQQEQQAAEGEQAQQHLGRNSLHHTLWQRLERAASGSAGSSSGGGAGGFPGEHVDSSTGSPAGAEEQGGAAAELPTDADPAPLFVPETLPRKLRKRRALSPEERLVLGILSDPQFDYRGRTCLPSAAPSQAGP